jgi:hypothetical protein
MGLAWGYGAGLVVLRVIGWLLILSALLFLGRDLFVWHESGYWAPLLVGKVWHDLSPDTLGLAQAGIERHVWKPLWDPVIFTLLLRPCWLVLGVPGILLAVLPRRSRKRRRFAR